MIKDKTNHIGVISIIYLREIQRNHISSRLTEREESSFKNLWKISSVD